MSLVVVSGSAAPRTGSTQTGTVPRTAQDRIPPRVPSAGAVPCCHSQAPVSGSLCGSRDGSFVIFAHVYTSPNLGRRPSTFVSKPGALAFPCINKLSDSQQPDGMIPTDTHPRNKTRGFSFQTGVRRGEPGKVLRSQGTRRRWKPVG